MQAARLNCGDDGDCIDGGGIATAVMEMAPWAAS
jgi:hypothetical protein